MDYNKQHWYYLVSKLFNIIKESVLGLIAFGIVAIKNASSIMLLIIILIGVLIITISVIGWLKEVYKIDNNAIHLKKGVFVVRDIVLPYNKVHSVDIASGVIQRIFKVCRIDIQSPGYNDHNSNITIIMSIQDAKQIKNNILGYTNQESESNESLIVKSDEVNYRATIKDILLCVITSSQITLGFSVILGIYLFLDQYIPKEYQDIAVNTSDLVFNRVFGESLFYKIMGMSMIILTLVIIISFVGTVIRYYDFTIKRESDKLKISYGLLSIKEITMPINRMLYIDIKEGLIQKPLGFCEVKIACIGYGNESGEKAILCPIIKRKDLPLLLKEVIPEISLDYNIDRVAKESLSMYIFISIWVWVLISIPVTIFIPYGYISIILVILFSCIGILRYKDNGTDYNDKLLYLRTRKIALHTTIVPKGRVQSISLIKNVLSSKKDMVRLRVSIQDTYFATIKTLRGIKIDIANKIIDEYK